MHEGDRDGGDGSGPLSRRRLLALSGAGLLGGLAGCGGDDGGGPSTTTTSAATDTTTGGSTTGTESTTAATETSTPSGAGSFDTSYLSRSPSSAFAPDAGFTSFDWLAEADDLDVLKVTTLANHGDGSLRWALEQRGPRVIVFEVGGVVDLEEEILDVGNGLCWVAGHTAPSPGITLIRGALYFSTNDVLAQHIRVRPGDAGNESDWEPDAINAADDTQNVAFDHVTATWGVDETLSWGWRCDSHTASNCLVAEALANASHHKGEHSAGTAAGDDSERFTFLGTIWANNIDRNPRVGADTLVLANSVVSHYENALNMNEPTHAAVENNVFLDAENPNDPVIEGGHTYAAGNRMDPQGVLLGDTEDLVWRPLWPDGLQALPNGQVVEHNLRNAGARPADRTPHDERVLDTVRNGTGAFIDSQEEVGGYPDLEPAERELDPPDPGARLAEWLYGHRRAVELPDATPP